MEVNGRLCLHYITELKHQRIAYVQLSKGKTPLRLRYAHHHNFLSLPLIRPRFRSTAVHTVHFPTEIVLRPQASVHALASTVASLAALYELLEVISLLSHYCLSGLWLSLPFTFC